VTVPTVDVPPCTELGFNETAATWGGLIVSTVETTVAACVAVIVTDVCAATARVLTVNVIEDLPAATVTDAGTVAEVLPLASLTIIPPVGAGPVKVTVPVTVVPPLTVDGLIETDFRPASPTVRVAVTVLVPDFAVIVAVCELVTTVEFATKIPESWPGDTVTVAGTVTIELLLVNSTTIPPLGAAPESVTVPAEVVPPAMLVGLNETESKVGGFTVTVADCEPAPSFPEIIPAT